MNRRQRRIVIIGLLVIAVMFIFPPVYYLYAPFQLRYTVFFAAKSVRQQVLVFQVVIVAVLTGALVLLFANNRD